MNSTEKWTPTIKAITVESVKPGAVLQQFEVEQRLKMPPFGIDECDEKERRRHEGRDCSNGSPAVLGRADETVDQSHRSQRSGRGAENVEGGRLGMGLAHQSTYSHDHRHSPGHVDEQRPPPRQEFGECAAQDQSRGGSHGRDSDEERHAASLLLFVSRHQDDQGQHARAGQRAADSLQHARRDQNARTLGEAAEKRSKHEDRQSGPESSHLSDHVAQPAAEQQQPAECQAERIEHPRQGSWIERRGPS